MKLRIQKTIIIVTSCLLLLNSANSDAQRARLRIDKRSSSLERIDIIDRYIELIGKLRESYNRNPIDTEAAKLWVAPSRQQAKKGLEAEVLGQRPIIESTRSSPVGELYRSHHQSFRSHENLLEALHRASVFIPKEYSNELENAVFYLEKTDKGYFYTSNYIEPSENIPHHRISTDAKFFEDTIKNSNSKVFIDESIFSSNGAPLVDLSSAGEIKIVSGKEGKELMDSPIKKLDTNKPPPLLVSKIKERYCCLYGIPPHYVSRYASSLEAKLFNKDNVRFISLVMDSATDSAIRNSPILHSKRISESPPTSVPELESAFQKSEGKTLFLMGHTEGGDFVVRDPQNTVTFKLSIDSVRDMAREYNVDLIDLGCETAKSIDQKMLRLGVMTRFNTVEAVKAIETALQESKNYIDLLSNMAANGLDIVVDNVFIDFHMKRFEVKANIFMRIRDISRTVLIKITSIFITLNNF